jgi:heparosan-N-sulfate-glucuronate 5-epimerase
VIRITRSAESRRCWALCMVTLTLACGFGAFATRAGATGITTQTSRYDPAGAYVGPFEKASNISPPHIILGSGRVPLVLYPGQGYHRNPVTSAQYGLWAYDLYLRTENRRYRRIVLRVADWLVVNQRQDRWFYDFNGDVSGIVIKKPWISAMAQGQAMSLLERAYRLTGNERYRSTALRSLVPLESDVRSGGVSRCFLGNCSLPFFEEAPTTPPSYILNGFMFTLIGLYDLASIAPRSQALPLYSAARRTLHFALPRYDVDGVASYDLTHLTVRGKEPTIATLSYQGVHLYLLRALDSLTPDPRFEHFADRWQKGMAELGGSRHQSRLWPSIVLAAAVIALVAIGARRVRRTRTAPAGGEASSSAAAD